MSPVQYRQADEVLIICVNYNARASTLSLCLSIKNAAKTLGACVLVVDNSGELARDEAFAECQRGAEGRVLMIAPGLNLGYFRGAAAGLKSYMGMTGRWPKWTIVCNPDTSVEPASFFENLLKIDPGTTGVLAPRIRVGDSGRDLNPYMLKRPQRSTLLLMRACVRSHALFQLRHYVAECKARQFRWIEKVARSGSRGAPACRYIYAPHGSFVVFSRSYFERGGYLDTNTFLWAEEITVAEIARRIGVTVRFEPALSVVHHEHESTGRMRLRDQFSIHAKSMRYVLATYFDVRGRA